MSREKQWYDNEEENIVKDKPCLSTILSNGTLFSGHVGYLVIRMMKKHRVQQCNVSIEIKIRKK